MDAHLWTAYYTKNKKYLPNFAEKDSQLKYYVICSVKDYNHFLVV